MCRTVPTLSYFYFFINKRFARAPNALENTFRHVAKASNLSGNDFRHARKCQTLRETTFAKRGNAKPFGKWLSPCAEMPNLSGNDFRQARKCQTFYGIICGSPASIKSFKKWFAGAPQASKLLKSDFCPLSVWRWHNGYDWGERFAYHCWCCCERENGYWRWTGRCITLFLYRKKAPPGEVDAGEAWMSL